MPLRGGPPVLRFDRANRVQPSSYRRLLPKPEAHHARVIVNAAKTVATFLVEAHLVQRERGLLSAPSKTDAAR